MIVTIKVASRSLNRCTILSSEKSIPPEHLIPPISNRCASPATIVSDHPSDRVKIAIYTGIFEVDGAEIKIVSFVNKQSLMELLSLSDTHFP